MLNSYEIMMLEEYTEQFNKEDRQKEYDLAAARIEKGEPVAYILGKQYFYNMYFKVTRDTLIPRPDTEHLVDMAIKRIPQNGKFADLCTGSGCIALTILYNRPDLCAAALDISEKALAVANENAEIWNLTDRFSAICSDILSDEPLSDEFDAVISNPPYITSDAMKDFPSLVYEPKIALDCGDDGMIFYRHFINTLTGHMKKSAVMILEIGYDQSERILKLCNSQGLSCELHRDFGGNIRVAVISCNGFTRSE